MELSEGRVYGARYYTVHPVLNSNYGHSDRWNDMMTWVINNFGPCTAPIWGADCAPQPMQRWYVNNAKFWFRNEKDLLLFILKWS